MARIRRARIRLPFTRYARPSSLVGASVAICIQICIQPFAGYGSLTGSGVWQQRPSPGIPEATLPCSDDVAKWWQEVRAAGMAALEASRAKDDALRKAFSEHRYATSDNRDEVLPRKQRDKLNAEIQTANAKYLGLLRSGQEKSYLPPIPTNRLPVVLYSGWPSYTEVARRNKTMGTVRAKVEFRSDGAIGNVTIVAGLPDGLSEMAINAIRQIIFLPALGSAGFETTSRPIDVDFNLR